MIDAAVLRAFVEARGCREATREVAKVQEQLKEARNEAVLATKAIERFGRMRGVAVLDVNAAKARAQTAQATKAVEDFGSTHGMATASVNATQVRGTLNEAAKQVRSYGQMNATATLDADATRVRFTTSQATREVGEFDRIVATATLAVDTANARREMAEMRREMDKTRDSMRHAGDGGRDGGNGITFFGRSFGDLPGRIFLSTRLLGALMNILVTMAPVLLGLAAQLVAVASALAPLVGLAAGVAGAMVAAAQGFGVLKLATMGVGDALKEQIQSQSQAGAAALRTAGQQVASSRAIRAAQEGAQAAHEAVRKATAALGPAYTEARMRLRDLRDAVIGASLSLRDAQFAAKDARQALAELLAGPSPRVLADAHRAVADSVRNERDAVQGLLDAHRALNELLAPPAVLDVADAHDAVADATRDETKAQIALARQIAATNAVLADPGSSDLDKAEARSRLADAENAVGDAARQSARAQERLRALEAGPTQDAIAEARRRVRDAEEAVARAKGESARAQEDLRAVETPASSDAIARARLAVAQAEHGLAMAMKDRVRAMRDAGIAEAQSIARSPAVLAAREALRSAALASARAERGVSEAQADAARSAAQAAAASGNLNEKLASLPAPAQAFVRVLASMKPRLDELRATAAGGFFPGATAGLQAAMQSFQSVNRVVGQTSTVLGEAARKSGELVGSPAFGRDIEIIGGRNAKVLGTLGEALRHIISAFRHVLVAAGPLTQWLADVANKWALNAAEAAKAGRESGKLADFFDRARETAQKLGSILGNLGSGLLGVGKASAGTGRDILDSLDRITARFAAWANSAKGRNEIAKFMREAHDAMREIGPALGALVAAFASFSANVLPAYARILSVIGPAMDELVTIFLAWKIAATAAAIATGTLTAAKKVGKGAMVAWGAATYVATQIAHAHTIGLRLMLAAMWQNVAAHVRAAAATVAHRAAMIASAAAAKATAAAQWLLNAAMAANPIGLVVIAIAALVAGLVLAYRESETFRNAVNAVWGALKDAYGWISDNWPLLLAILTGPIGLAVLVIASHWESIKGAASAAWGWLAGAAATAWNLIKTVITTPIQVAAAVIGGIWAGMKAAAELAWAGIKSAASLAWEGIKTVIISPVRSVAGWVGERFNDLKDGLGVIWGAIKSVAGTAWGGIKTAIIDPIGDAIKFVKDKIGDVVGWLGDKWAAMTDGAKVFGLLFNNTMARAFGGIANVVIGFINAIIGAINTVLDLVGIGKIGKVDKVDVPDALSVKDAAKIVNSNARGGTFARTGAEPGAVAAFAHGGAFARTGGLVNSPITLMGEEAPKWPEIVVPLNPAYRSRAQGLAAYAANAVGVEGFAEGGVVKAFRGAIDKTNASPKPSLALWMAGIVESGLRNLTYGDRDSLGALQVRAGIHGRDLAMDPYRSALAFLTRGFTGIGGAIELAPLFPTAGRVAQAVQGSAYPDRYDAVRGQAMQYLKGGGEGGGPLAAIGGAISSVGGVLGDLLSKGAGFLLDKLPGVGDLPDWLKGTGKYVLDKVGKWIKDKVSGLVGAGGGGGGGAGGGDVKGLQPQVTAALAFAKSHGWGGRVNSGFRSRAEQQRLYEMYLNGTGNRAAPPGNSMHEKGLAVDVSAAEQFARAMGMMGAGRLYRKVPGEPWHFSTTGYAKGGQYGSHMGAVPFVGSYGAGGTIPRDGMAYVHRGESVTPAGGATVEDLVDALSKLNLTVMVGGQAIDERVEIVVDRRDRRTAAEWRAGRV